MPPQNVVPKRMPFEKYQAYQPVPLPGYLYRPRGLDGPRPTVLLPDGFYSTAEEAYKFGVSAGLAMGWNVFTWDGPGQGAMLFEDRVTMRPDFENVVTAVVDWAVAQPSVDPVHSTYTYRRQFPG